MRVKENSRNRGKSPVWRDWPPATDEAGQKGINTWMKR
nr:MAG TPA: hypothetical protein [Caudoviricetes sp.]